MKKETKTCKWSIYKGLWYQECNGFKTTTLGYTTKGGLCSYDRVYATDELPWDFICPECGKAIEIADRRFGRIFSRR